MVKPADYLVREMTKEIMGMLPKELAYARAIARSVAERAGLKCFPIWHERGGKLAILAFLTAAFLLGMVCPQLVVAGGAESANRRVVIRARVMLWDDGKAVLYFVEDRASDPDQVWRVIRTEAMTADRLEAMFGRPVAISGR